MSIVRKYRLKNKVTQIELARHLKVTPQFICIHEKGAAPLPKLLMRKCARYLGISPVLLVNERMIQLRKEYLRAVGVKS